ncbi:MmgE/PrpD family protein [Pseudomonas sp. DWP3-1-2]|uniref:MmgE/PrpD family protein n=1 Tax=Pseudomonas sp. DWP3-1-2 TaxID=2804645 RepID=UPI003CF96646
MTLIDTLAQRITAGLSLDAMESAAPMLSVHVLDTVGAWIAGRATTEGRLLNGLRGGLAAGHASFDSSVLDTVGLFTATARLTEVDDIHMASCTTPGALVVMTALALAANVPCGLLGQERFAQAVHVGYEVMTGLGEAVSGPQILHQGVWPSLLLAPVTAAAVTAKLLNLDAERTAHALSIALTASNGRPGGNASAGVASVRGTSARWLLFGMAARTGCAAAMSAAAGFTGDRGLLENDQASPMRGMTLSHTRIASILQGTPALLETSIKPYCAAKHNIAAMFGFRQLLDQGIAHESLTAVRVRLPPSHAKMVAHYDVETSRLSRVTSCAYNLALMGVMPDDLLDVDRTQAHRSVEMTRLAGKIDVVADEQLQGATPQSYPAVVELLVGDRVIASETIIHALGDPQLPFQIEDARRKFRRLARGLLEPSAALKIENLCLEAPNSAHARASVWKQLTGFDRRESERDPTQLTHLRS